MERGMQMTNTPPQLPPNLPFQLPILVVKKPKKKLSTLVILLIIAFGIIALGISAIVGIGVYGARQMKLASTDTLNLLDTFMKKMDSKDPENAFWLYSPSGRKNVTILDLRAIVEDETYALFEGYKETRYSDTGFDVAFNSDPSLPNGVILTASGTFWYNDGSSKEFEAVFEKVDGKWMIYGISIPYPEDEYQVTV
jgi:hypothetical protein